MGGAARVDLRHEGSFGRYKVAGVGWGLVVIGLDWVGWVVLNVLETSPAMDRFCLSI